jgi:hypothetical protein
MNWNWNLKPLPKHIALLKCKTIIFAVALPRLATGGPLLFSTLYSLYILLLPSITVAAHAKYLRKQKGTIIFLYANIN